MNTFEDFLNNNKTRFTNRFLAFTKNNYWELKLSVFCFLITACFSFPNFSEIKVSNNNTWDVVQKQISDPTVQYNLDYPFSHNAKRTFRLTIPIIFKVLHINNVIIIYIFQLILAVCFFLLIINFCKDFYPNNKISWLIIPLSFCFTYLGQVGIVDVFAKFDSIAIFCLLSAMCFRNPFLIFLFSLAAAFTDERGFIALIIVYLWWQLKKYDLEKIGIITLFIPSLKSISVLFAMFFYALLRLFLQHKYGFITVKGGIGFDILTSQFNMLLFGLWSAFEGFWLIILVALFDLILNKKTTFLVVLILFIIPSFLSSFLVLDITRSLIYTIPFLIITMYIISKFENKAFYNGLFFFVFLINFLTPTYFAEGAFRIEGSNPILFKILNLAIHR